MHLLMLILGIVLLPEAYTLTCIECTPGPSGSCTETKECPSQGQQCGALRVLSYAGRFNVVDYTIKRCVVAEECIEGSANLGMGKILIASKCCTTELCNAQLVPEPSKSSPNGKKCITCDEQTCTKTLNCEGDEDYCFTSKLTLGNSNVTMKGCASKIICSNTLPAEISGAIGTEISCCQGNYCNSASSTSAGLLLLLTPLVSLVVFS